MMKEVTIIKIVCKNITLSLFLERVWSWLYVWERDKEKKIDGAQLYWHLPSSASRHMTLCLSDWPWLHDWLPDVGARVYIISQCPPVSGCQPMWRASGCQPAHRCLLVPQLKYDGSAKGQYATMCKQMESDFKNNVATKYSPTIHTYIYINRIWH